MGQIPVPARLTMRSVSTEYSARMPCARSAASPLSESVPAYTSRTPVRAYRSAAAFPTILSAAEPPRRSSPCAIHSRRGRMPRCVLVRTLSPLCTIQVRLSRSSRARSAGSMSACTSVLSDMVPPPFSFRTSPWRRAYFPRSSPRTGSAFRTPRRRCRRPP